MTSKSLSLLKASLKWLVIVVVIGLVVYYFRFAPVSVQSHAVARGLITAEVMGTGTLEARVATSISPKISGRIVELLVDQGSRVETGELLVRLDDAELQQQVAIADANVEAAQAALRRLSADKDRALAVFEQARRNEVRVRSLLEKSAISQEEVDKASEALAVAQAEVGRAEAAIAEGQKVLVAAEKTAQYHSARLQDTQIIAPFDGLVVNRSREAGDVVVPGTSILTLISTDELWVSAWVDETEMSRVAPDQPARAVFRSEPHESFEGSVTRLGREADRETREFIVDVRVLELPVNWAVGQRAEVFIQVDERNDALLVPANLLLRQDGQTGVFVIENGVAQWRVLQLGLRNREQVEVVEGLQENEQVISPIGAKQTLTSGRRITVR